LQDPRLQIDLLDNLMQFEISDQQTVALLNIANVAGHIIIQEAGLSVVL